MRENTRGYRHKTVNLHVELVSDAPSQRTVFQRHRKVCRKHGKGRRLAEASAPAKGHHWQFLRKVRARILVDVVSIDLVHLLVSIQKGGTGNIAIFSCMGFVHSFVRLSRRGASLGLVQQEGDIPWTCLYLVLFFLNRLLINCWSLVSFVTKYADD
jgi:hypothetical protein